MRAERSVLALALILALSGGMHAQTTVSVTLEQYVGTLQHIAAHTRDHELTVAKSEVATLSGAEVESASGRFHVDESLIAAISDARGSDPALLTRIELTIGELRGAVPAGAAPDPKLLQQVAAEQGVPELARGGEVASPVMAEAPLLERIAESIAKMFRWISKKITKLIEWLLDFLPRRQEEPGETTGMRWIVIGVVSLIVIAIVFLAIEVVRRTRRGDVRTIASSAPPRSAHDADPLSRGASEWERYATQLAGEGRFREAIRAWYHAVLVTCYAAGALHFRKGRTNWEYIASLPPSTAWRPELMRLTQRFEQEWYGSDESTADALDDCSAHARNILNALQHHDALQHTGERGAA